MGAGEPADWPTQLPPGLRCSDLTWPTPSSTPAMKSWSMWRDQCWCSKDVGSPWHKTTTKYLNVSQWRSTTDGGTEARSFKSDQWLLTMNICKKICLENVYTVWHTVTVQLSWQGGFCFRFFFLLFCFLWGGRLQGYRGIGRDWKMSGITVHDGKFTKNQ